MTEDDWYAPARTLALFLSGGDIPDRDEHGRDVLDESFLLVLHAGHEPADVLLPPRPWAEVYELVLDTSREDQEAEPGTRYAAGTTLAVPSRSVLLLRSRRAGAANGGGKARD
jgi:glycogen operon protein